MSDRINIRAAASADVERRIRCVPEYADQDRIQFSQEIVAQPLLRPLCGLARTYRLEPVSRLIAAYDASRLPLFTGIWLTCESDPARLIPPPIIEEHSGQLVVIDGLHRLLEAARSRRHNVSVVVLRGELPRLPAEMLTWRDVWLTDHETPRIQKFRNFDESAFRRIHEHIDRHS